MNPDLEIIGALALVFLAKVLAVLGPDDASVINTALNTLGIVGVAIVGYLQARVIHENREGRKRRHRRETDPPQRRRAVHPDADPHPGGRASDTPPRRRATDFETHLPEDGG